ncbi:MAG: triose-phosphate isomerase [Pseudomonadota bacterium]
MTHKTPTIVSNWKMNGTVALLNEAVPIWHKAASYVNWVFCPPATLISYTKEHFPNVVLGGQDCSAKAYGAFTGNISAAQLVDVGAAYVIVGHSECRQHNGDTNADVAAKACAAQHAGLMPIICIGESEATYVAGQTLAFLKQQLDESLTSVQGEFLLAYEPIWAIGTGKTATPDDIRRVHSFLREQLPSTPLLYGGSVSADNARAILAVDNVDGVLVGGASLKVAEFKAILEAGC